MNKAHLPFVFYLNNHYWHPFVNKTSCYKAEKKAFGEFFKLRVLGKNGRTVPFEKVLLFWAMAFLEKR
jgi:hypothetical protein